MKTLSLLLAILLLLAGCAETENPGEVIQGGAPLSTQEESVPATPEEILCQELRRRGIADYDSGELKPYDGNVNGCVSCIDGDYRKWDREDLLMYRIDGEDEGHYEIVAVTKDLEYFFTMSHVDGIFYDIRNDAAYIHDGEYTREEAQRELERYLRAETDIDPDRYDLTVYAHWVDEGYNYCIDLYQPGTQGQGSPAYEFYVSKDLRRIARIDYREEPGERSQYICEVILTDDPAESYTAEEVKDLLLDWLRQHGMPQAEEADILIELDGTEERPPFGTIPAGIYRYRVPLEDGTAWEFETFADLCYTYQSLVTPSEEPRMVEYYTYLKDNA